MRNESWVVLWIVTLGYFARAAEPSTRPATAPTVFSKVLLLPFQPVDPAQSMPAVGRGLQQALLADFAKMSSLQPVTLSVDRLKTISAEEGYNSNQVANLAHDESAHYVIYGTYQHLNQELRISGVVYDAEASRVIGGLKSTASLRDLFDMEDSLTHQARVLLVPPVATTRLKVEQPVAHFDGPIANPYAMHYEDPAIKRSRITLQTSLDYVYPPCGYGCGGYFGGGYYGGAFGGFGGYSGSRFGYSNYTFNFANGGYGR